MAHEDCAICGHLLAGIEGLDEIARYIKKTSPKKKVDFGLYLSAVLNNHKMLLRLLRYHENYHSGDKMSSDPDSEFGGF